MASKEQRLSILKKKPVKVRVDYEVKPHEDSLVDFLISEDPIQELDLLLANASPININYMKNNIVPEDHEVFMNLDRWTIGRYETFLKEKGPIILINENRDIDYFKIFISTAFMVNKYDLLNNLPTIWTMASMFNSEHKKTIERDEKIESLCVEYEKDLKKLERIIQKEYDESTARVEELIDTKYAKPYLTGKETKEELVKRADDKKFMYDYATNIFYMMSFPREDFLIADSEEGFARKIFRDIGIETRNSSLTLIGYSDEETDNLKGYSRILSFLDANVKSKDLVGLLDQAQGIIKDPAIPGTTIFTQMPESKAGKERKIKQYSK